MSISSCEFNQPGLKLNSALYYRLQRSTHIYIYNLYEYIVGSCIEMWTLPVNCQTWENRVFTRLKVSVKYRHFLCPQEVTHHKWSAKYMTAGSERSVRTTVKCVLQRHICVSALELRSYQNEKKLHVKLCIEWTVAIQGFSLKTKPKETSKLSCSGIKKYHIYAFEQFHVLNEDTWNTWKLTEFICSH